MKKAFFTTVHILIKDIEEEGGACDFMSSLLSENEYILDWSYFPKGQYDFHYPEPVTVPDDYEEGQYFEYMKLKGKFE